MKQLCIISFGCFVFVACATIDIANLPQEQFIQDTPDACASVTGTFADTIVPIFSSRTCSNSGCHAAAAPGGNLNLEGTPEEILAQINANDRINITSPNDSKLLRKPLGLDSHAGSAVFASTEDSDYILLGCWIKAGATTDF